MGLRMEEGRGRGAATTGRGKEVGEGDGSGEVRGLRRREGMRGDRDCKSGGAGAVAEEDGEGITGKGGQ